LQRFVFLFCYYSVVLLVYIKQLRSLTGIFDPTRHNLRKSWPYLWVDPTRGSTRPMGWPYPWVDPTLGHL